MNNVAKNEDEKGKESKKAEDEESDEDYEDEALEDAPEGSFLEEASLSETGVPSYFGSAHPSVSDADSESEKGQRDSYLEKRQEILREKWFSVVGRKPKSVPTVKRFYLEEDESPKIVFFGDRAQGEVERKRREKWLKMVTAKPKTPIANQGKLRCEMRLPALSKGVLCVRFDTNGESMATSYRTGGVQVRKITGEVTTTLRAIETVEKLSLRSLRYHPRESHTLYMGGAAGVVQIFDIETSALLGMSHYMNEINNVDISPDGSTTVAVGQNGTVCVMDSFNLEVISRRERPNLDMTTISVIDDELHRMRVYGLRFHPKEPHIFITGSWDHTVKIWDTRIPFAVTSIRGPFVSGDAVDIKDNKIVTASWVAENSLTLWDFPSGKEIKSISLKNKASLSEGEFLYAVRYFHHFSGGGGSGTLIAIGGSGFEEASVVNVDTGTVLASFPTYKPILCLDTMTNLVAYGGKESLLRIGEVVPHGHGKSISRQTKA